MSLGNCIVVTPEPKGRFEEIIIVGTPKPGTMMHIISATSPVGGNPSGAGRFSYEPAGTTAASGSRGMSADGDRIPIAVLCAPGETAGSTPSGSSTTAFATGDRGTIYWPQEGDLCNILYQNASGTADDVAVGDKLIVDDGTGKVLVSTGSVESEPWEAREAYTDPSADQLILAVFTGM